MRIERTVYSNGFGVNAPKYVIEKNVYESDYERLEINRKQKEKVENMKREEKDWELKEAICRLKYQDGYKKKQSRECIYVEHQAFMKDIMDSYYEAMSC